MIIGDNGVGKTTILRSIALGLSEQSGAAGLVDELEGNWIRLGEKEATIKIEIEPFPGYKGEAFISTIFTEADDLSEVYVEQHLTPEKPRKFKWNDLFVCAYGAARRQYGSRSYSEYTVTDSVYSLFNYDSHLQNPELNIRRLTSLGIEERDIFRRIEKVLMLDDGSITMDKTGIKISGFWGDLTPMGAIGDGYQATIAWMLDMYGWKLLFEEKVRDAEIKGIILIDEIEYHLHPKWQKRIVKLLVNQFPDLQFIATSHSPLAVVGMTELADEECSIGFLYQVENYVESVTTTPLRRKRVDQVLTSYLFDLDTTGDNAIKDDIERYSVLYSKESRTQKENYELTKLNSSLKSTLASGETDLEIKATKALNRIINEFFDEKIKLIKNKKSPIHYELLRQLKELSK